MLSDRADPPQIRNADIIEFPAARRRSEPQTPVAALRRATDDLAERSRALDRQARSLAGQLAGFDQISRRLAAEATRARAISAEAERVAVAIDAGDLDALNALRDEVLRERAARAF
jgi:uncharacterized protein (DUF3084 family)